MEVMAVLISINKPHTDDIFSGEKGLEWRKHPLPEDLYYVYETKNKGGCGKVIGEMRIVGNRAVDTSGPLEVYLVNAGRVHPVTLKKYANNGVVYANFIKDAKRYAEPKELQEFRRPCISPEFPYCPDCPVGGEYISESELESLAMDGECRTEWYCNNVLKRPPQSWCYVEERYDRS